MAARRLSTDEARYELWRKGHLRWLLRPHQIGLYDHYREWELQDPSRAKGTFGRIYVMDVGRRVGKTTIRSLVRFEDCIRSPGRSYRYVTAFQKDIEEIVDEVAEAILETCPREFRPEYKLRNKARPAGFYFPNGSLLKTAGLDKNKDGLRGRSSDGDDVSEAVFIRYLVPSIKRVLYQQYQGRSWARMCLESSAPEGPDTEYDTLLVADAKMRGAYVFSTIDDNTFLSDEEREEFIRAAGGRDHPDCRREYFCERVRDEGRAIIPEFDRTKHVGIVDTPDWYHAYVGMDPGMADLMAIVFAYWHAELGKLVVQRGWHEFNAGTREVSDAIQNIELELWEGSQYWDGSKLCSNPYTRVSDTELRLIYDLDQDHGIEFQPADKEGAEAALKALRDAFRNDQILVHPDAAGVIEHLLHGKWNEARTRWDRHPVYGHYDYIDALKYLWRHLNKNLNPTPPDAVLNPDLIDVSAQLRHSMPGVSRDTHTSLAHALGRRRKWRK